MSVVARRPFDMRAVADAAAFCAAHPVNFRRAPEFERTLAMLVSGPDAVIDVYRGDERVLFANVLDRLNETDEVTSAVVGARALSPADGAAAADLVLSASEQVTAGRAFVVSWRHPLPPGAAAAFERRGYDLSVRELTMERSPAAPAVGDPELPHGWRWVALEPPLLDRFVALVTAAFAESGLPMPSPDVLTELFGGAGLPPWGLFDRDELIGVSRIEHDEGNGAAEIGPIARAPACVGRGIGRILTAKAIHELTIRTRLPIRLDVRADNHRAIRVYRAFGFEVRHETGWYRRRRPAARP